MQLGIVPVPARPALASRLPVAAGCSTVVVRLQLVVARLEHLPMAPQWLGAHCRLQQNRSLVPTKFVAGSSKICGRLQQKKHHIADPQQKQPPVPTKNLTCCSIGTGLAEKKARRRLPRRSPHPPALPLAATPCGPSGEVESPDATRIATTGMGACDAIATHNGREQLEACGGGGAL